MFMFTTTRNGVAAKEIQRQKGVTHKTAWRMARLIREYIGYVDGDAPARTSVSQRSTCLSTSARSSSPGTFAARRI